MLVRILFHSRRSCVLPPAAWRGHVARRDLQHVKEARREAAICIQSGETQAFRVCHKFSYGLSQSVGRRQPQPPPPPPPLIVPAYMLRRKRDKGPPEKGGKKNLHLCEAPF